MKKYFAKYLPVEGEIKEGDWVINPNKPLQRAYIQSDPIYLKEYRKAKLFLCSRDIQVGDLVFALNEEEAGNVVDLKDLCYWQSKKSYKIIGEISPEATWVKEGDEFEGEGIDFVSTISDKEYRNKTANNIYFKILGPCGHFH